MLQVTHEDHSIISQTCNFIIFLLVTFIELFCSSCANWADAISCTPDCETEQVNHVVFAKSKNSCRQLSQIPPEPVGKHLYNQMSLLDPLIFKIISKTKEYFSIRGLSFRSTLLLLLEKQFIQFTERWLCNLPLTLTICLRFFKLMTDFGET